jgi:opacity protein-like surface antigen
MKNVLLVLAVLVVCAVPAFAEDVPDAMLSALGLGGMQVVSDAQGMQVRGMSSASQGQVLPEFTLNLFDPSTGASWDYSSSASGEATDENAGLNATTAIEQAQVIQLTGPTGGALVINIDVAGQDVYDATVTPFQNAAFVNAGSPEPANPITFTVMQFP